MHKHTHTHQARTLRNYNVDDFGIPLKDNIHNSSNAIWHHFFILMLPYSRTMKIFWYKYWIYYFIYDLVSSITIIRQHTRQHSWQHNTLALTLTLTVFQTSTVPTANHARSRVTTRWLSRDCFRIVRCRRINSALSLNSAIPDLVSNNHIPCNQNMDKHLNLIILVIGISTAGTLRYIYFSVITVNDTPAQVGAGTA